MQKFLIAALLIGSLVSLGSSPTFAAEQSEALDNPIDNQPVENSQSVSVPNRDVPQSKFLAAPLARI